MTNCETVRRPPVTVAKLAAVMTICLGFATTTNVGAANTSPSPKAKASPAAPLPNELSLSPQDQRGHAFDVLTPTDAALYRTIFAAQRRNEWDKAETAMAGLTDKRLMGHVLAERYLQLRPTRAELAAWLKKYGDLPQAEAIHARAARLAATDKTARGTALPAPSTPDAWSGGYAVDSAADFSVDLSAGNTPPDSSARRLARSINQALHLRDPETARNILIAAEAAQPLVGTFAADAKAAIAAGFFYAGERQQARALASAAGAANQPTGLWINGLIAWEQNDAKTASASFLKLADHPSLNPGTRAAAEFWAYRSLSRAGDKKTAWKHLERAAQSPLSFYGLLAAQLMGRDPVAQVARVEHMPVWNAALRDLLAAKPAGGRALALLQIDEPALAEGELRHLNPHGQADLQKAMLALAGYVPMPALAMQLASLSSPSDQRYDAAFYPLPPWQPEQGFQVDRALLFALARHESQFDPSAVSARGARGLMQLMPGTADGMADDATPSSRKATNGKLFEPEYNLMLGQRYVRHLAERPQVGDNLMLLLAAYNGGPNNVARWKQAGNQRDPLLFMETIPLRETRNYITRVLPHYWAYRARLNEPLTSLQQMAEGQWPRYTLTDTIREAATTGIRVASSLTVQ